MAVAFVNGRVLTDTGVQEGLIVLTNNAHVASVTKKNRLPPGDAEQINLDGKLLLPGFVDTQVNGGGGTLFNDHPAVETIAEIGRAHRQFGTTAFLPTLVSDDLSVVAAAISAVREAITAGIPGVLGIHIEGPFLNEARRGIHDASKIRHLDEEAFRLLTTPSGGKTLVTLAPEKTTPGMVRRLVDAGVVISAGHSNATYAQVRERSTMG